MTGSQIRARVTDGWIDATVDGGEDVRLRKRGLLRCRRGGGRRMSGILNEKAPMQYRRFGRTERELSVITLGGMRYRSAGGQPREEAPDEAVEHCADMVQRAFAAGINHIETAWGSGKSEYVYGKALDEIVETPRDQYHFMTKGSPHTAKEMREMVEEQLRGLRMEKIDLYGWHGINTPELYDIATKKGSRSKNCTR